MTNIESRYQKLRSYMNENGLDAIYVNSPENYLYMSGFDNPDGYIFITKTESYLFADPRYIEAAKAEAAPICKVCLPEQPTLKQIVSDNNIKTIGYEDMKITCFELNSLSQSLPEQCWEFKRLGTYFTDLRAIKTPDEIENIIAAQRIAEKAFDHICKNISYNMTEIEVAAELEYFMKKNGSIKPSFDTVCVSGTASSRPHGVPRPVKLEKGFLTMDFGAMVNGYHSDMTRTIVIGKADAEIKKIYNTLLEAQAAAMYAVAPGVKNRDIDGIARKIIYDAGYEGKFGHGLGHGVGLEIHELPPVSQRAAEDRVLSVGEVITDEPGIYLEGKYGCRIEDMILVTDNGYKNLTNCTHDLIEI